MSNLQLSLKLQEATNGGANFTFSFDNMNFFCFYLELLHYGMVCFVRLNFFLIFKMYKGNTYLHCAQISNPIAYNHLQEDSDTKNIFCFINSDVLMFLEVLLELCNSYIIHQSKGFLAPRTSGAKISMQKI